LSNEVDEKVNGSQAKGNCSCGDEILLEKVEAMVFLAVFGHGFLWLELEGFFLMLHFYI
jgi:hypothetical protein